MYMYIYLYIYIYMYSEQLRIEKLKETLFRCPGRLVMRWSLAPPSASYLQHVRCDAHTHIYMTG